MSSDRLYRREKGHSPLGIDLWFMLPSGFGLMNTLLVFFCSLFFTGLVAFATPLLVVGLLIMALRVLELVPVITTVSQTTINQVQTVLATFGSGEPLEGLIVIGFTCSVVGVLFDTYTFYRGRIFNSS